MGISLKPKHLKRNKDIAALLIKHGRSDLVRNGGLDTLDVEPDTATPQASKADELAHDVERLGPTFVKLGQLLSTRLDLLPIAYTQALSRLRDNRLEPFPFDEVETIIAGELGVRLSKAFAEFNAEPLAAASLGQVHQATLRDGRRVAVKVQRPGIREVIASDMEALEAIAQFIDTHTEWGKCYEFGRILEEFRRSLWRESDYRQQAQNLLTMQNNLSEFDKIMVPAPIEDQCTSRVVTMEQIRGRKITELGPLARLEFIGEELAGELFRGYLQQILVDGLFHADPHPGNVFLSDDVAEIAVKISEPRPWFAENEYRRFAATLVSEHLGSKLDQIDVGKVMIQVTQVSGEKGLRVPSELTMLGKTLLNPDIIARALDPKFDPTTVIRRNAERLLQQRMWKGFSPAYPFGGLLEVKDFLVLFPSRMNRILDAIARNELRVHVETIDETVIIEGVQKIANRISVGLILAALIVGAAPLMRVDTPFRLFGYPGFAIRCFLLAASSGFILIIRILFQDRRARRRG